MGLPEVRDARQLAEPAAYGSGSGYCLGVCLSRYQDAYPPDLQAMVAAQCATSEMLTCPAVRGSDPHARYEYIPGPHERRPGLVLLYERPGHHHSDGGFVLFEDGHVRWVQPYSRVLELVEQTKQQLAGQQVTASP